MSILRTCEKKAEPPHQCVEYLSPDGSKCWLTRVLADDRLRPFCSCGLLPTTTRLRARHDVVMICVLMWTVAKEIRKCMSSGRADRKKHSSIVSTDRRNCPVAIIVQETEALQLCDKKRTSHAKEKPRKVGSIVQRLSENANPLHSPSKPQSHTYAPPISSSRIPRLLHCSHRMSETIFLHRTQS